MELMAQMQAQMAELRPAVQYWMNWMAFIFVVAIVFAWKRPAARWTLAALVASALLGPVVFALGGTVHLLGIVHFLLWLPLLVYLIREEIRKPGFEAGSVYGVWVLLLSATIVISLLFDARDIVLVAMGQK